MPHPLEILEKHWNYTSFRPMQEDIINAVIDNEDVFVLMPTGGGKSLCYQVPALAKEGICIVISPLIALMKDQVSALKKRDIKAVALTSEYSYDELSVQLDNCIYGNYKFLYLSPERLQQDIVQQRLKQMNVNLIAVDEAHCISQWGNDFRPAYKNITFLRELLPTTNIIALTASAKKEVVDDIISELDFISPKVFKQSFKRDNLSYMVFDVEDKYYKIEQILNKNPQSSIIYVRNRKATIELNNYLESKGFLSTYYHGGLNYKEKELHFNEWKNNQKQVIVATNAFGMGIDKADVKTVIHVNLPESLESYFQEAGRAGRNSKKAFAVILKNKQDEETVVHQFVNILPSVDFIKHVYKRLNNYFQISYGEGDFTTHDFDFSNFCKTYKLNAILAFNALKHLDRTSVLSLSQQFQKHSSIRVLVTNNSIFDYIRTHPETTLVLKSILRTYGGVYDFDTKIDTLLIARKAEVTEERVIILLKQLEKDNIISLSLKTTDAQISFLVPREDDKTINAISKTIEQQNKLKKNQVEAVIDYINNIEACKSMQLLSYFGETKLEPCGICNVCLDIDNIDTYKVSALILKALSKQDLSSRSLEKKCNINELKLTKAIKALLEEGKIEITNKNTYKLK